ncbi:MAG: hypothetical protein JNL67_02530 [Planctomycetaceae bacterium]|nr:hypothetical protein [Planctomycetaceae bacterium]
MNDLEQQFRNMHQLDSEQRKSLLKLLETLKPDFLRPYFQDWLWWRRCRVNVLLVCDGGLNFGTGGFGLSEFLTAFNQLQATTWADYRLTLAHRSSSVASPNPLVVAQINNFNFATSVALSDFDQVWLFGIDPSGSISVEEIAALEAYMNGGGGLFATGDHGALGKSMCGNIPRVKDMRYWDDFPNSSNDINEVSMGGPRRNDTNRPASGAATSVNFENQSDAIPQTIAARSFGRGTPHPLLSISPRIRPSGVIDIMPDHPHEGQCAPERMFEVNGATVSSQIIATSFVLSGSTTAGGNGKTLTIPHCFPSIAVWDGRIANVGRIVVDSTWHHFVNINLNGAETPLTGLTSSDFEVVRQYFMNIATWISRKKSFLCWRRFILFDLLVNSQLIEANLNNPQAALESIALEDLNNIGSLAEEILANKFSPAFARSFLVEMLAEVQPELASKLDVWRPVTDGTEKQSAEHVPLPWLNTDFLLWTSIGCGFIALRDSQQFSSPKLTDEGLAPIIDVFGKGLVQGLALATKDFRSAINSLSRLVKLDL